MNYVILFYFFMVHLCYIKISADPIRYESKGTRYDIDGFISQLLASRKFDVLADKLAEKAANRIMLIDAEPSPVERATDDNDVNNITENSQEVTQNQSNKEYGKKNVKNQLNRVKLRKDFAGKINPQAVINASTSLSENLRLKYKFLKKNALDRKIKNNRYLLPKNDTKEENKATGPMDFRDQHNKTEARPLNRNATAKNQNDTIQVLTDESKRSRYDNGRNKSPNMNSEYPHSGTDGETNNSSKKPNFSLEEQSPGHEQPIFREAQISGPEDKGIVEKKASRVGIEREDKLSSLEEENQKHLTRSEEKIEEVEKNEEEPVKRATGYINEGENVIPQFRAHEDSIEENKVTFDKNPYGGVSRNKASNDRSSVKGSPEDQSSIAQSAENSNSSKFKPVIRQEGDKLYTYERAPEYADYHEKLTKWQRKHPDNPADFMK